MQTLMSVVRGFLAKKGYHVERRGHRLRVAIGGDNGVWYHQIAINEDDRWLVCRSRLPFEVPPDLRRKAAVLITRLNCQLILGGFELDMSDGEVCFKTSALLTEDELTEKMVEDLLYRNFSTFDRCLPGFMALVHGHCTIPVCLKMAKEFTETTAEEEAARQPQLPPGDGATPETP